MDNFLTYLVVVYSSPCEVYLTASPSHNHILNNMNSCPEELDSIHRKQQKRKKEKKRKEKKDTHNFDRDSQIYGCLIFAHLIFDYMSVLFLLFHKFMGVFFFLL